MTLIRVKDKEGLYRDENTNAIVNMNEDEYKNYIDSYRRIANEKNKINSLETEVKNIKEDLEEIKTLLRNLANGS